MQRRGSINNKPGNVYFLELLDPSKNFDFPFYKIGVTEHEVPDRIDQLQTGNPFKILKHHSFNSSAMEMVEKYLHNRYSSSRVRREWFRFNPKELPKALKEAARFNGEINELVDAIKEFDTEPSNGKIIGPDDETSAIHNILKEYLGEKRQLEAKEEISRTLLQILTTDTLGIEGITDVHLRHFQPRFDERGLKQNHPKIYEKYVEIETQTHEPDTEIRESFSSIFNILKKPTIRSFPDLQQELNDTKAKLENLERNDLQEELLDRTNESKALHGDFLDNRQKIGILDGQIEALGLKLRYHCKDNDGIDGICTYVRQLEIIEPDKNAKPEVIENKYFNEENFEESEPELYKKYALESPPSRVFQVIKYRDYI